MDGPSSGWIWTAQKWMGIMARDECVFLVKYSQSQKDIVETFAFRKFNAVCAIYQNSVEVQKRQIFQYVSEKNHNLAPVARIDLKKRPMAMI